MASEKVQTLTLTSLVGAKPIIYNWPKNKNDGSPSTEEIRRIGEEIIQTIRLVRDELPASTAIVVDKNILSSSDLNNLTEFEVVEKICQKFNKAIKSMYKLSTRIKKHKASKSLLRHIMKQVYLRAVTDPNKLNKGPQESRVYGETLFDFSTKIFDEMNLNENDKFIDLGSGVGNVVLTAAAYTDCKECIGVEIQDIPAEFAKKMELHFKFFMDWYGKKYQPFKLVKDSFLKEPWVEEIKQSTAIFSNNYKFGPELNEDIKKIIEQHEHRDRLRIVVSAPLRTMKDREITQRNYRELESIMTYGEIQGDCHSVSWTSTPVTFFIHKLDESKLYHWMNSHARTSRPNSVASQDTRETHSPSPNNEQQINIQERRAKEKSVVGRKQRKTRTRIKNQNSEEDLKSSSSSISSQDLKHSEEHAVSGSTNVVETSKDDSKEHIEDQKENFENEGSGKKKRQLRPTRKSNQSQGKRRSERNNVDHTSRKMHKSAEDIKEEVPVVKSRRGRKQKQQHVINENIVYLDQKTRNCDVKDENGANIDDLSLPILYVTNDDKQHKLTESDTAAINRYLLMLKQNMVEQLLQAKNAEDSSLVKRDKKEREQEKLQLREEMNRLEDQMKHTENETKRKMDKREMQFKLIKNLNINNHFLSYLPLFKKITNQFIKNNEIFKNLMKLSQPMYQQIGENVQELEKMKKQLDKDLPSFVFQGMDRHEEVVLCNNNINFGYSGQIGIPNNNIPVQSGYLDNQQQFNSSHLSGNQHVAKQPGNRGTKRTKSTSSSRSSTKSSKERKKKKTEDISDRKISSFSQVLPSNNGELYHPPQIPQVAMATVARNKSAVEMQPNSPQVYQINSLKYTPKKISSPATKQMQPPNLVPMQARRTMSQPDSLQGSINSQGKHNNPISTFQYPGKLGSQPVVPYKPNNQVAAHSSQPSHHQTVSSNQPSTQSQTQITGNSQYMYHLPNQQILNHQFQGQFQIRPNIIDKTSQPPTGKPNIIDKSPTVSQVTPNQITNNEVYQNVQSHLTNTSFKSQAQLPVADHQNLSHPSMRSHQNTAQLVQAQHSQMVQNPVAIHQSFQHQQYQQQPIHISQQTYQPVSNSQEMYQPISNNQQSFQSTNAQHLPVPPIVKRTANTLSNTSMEDIQDLLHFKETTVVFKKDNTENVSKPSKGPEQPHVATTPIHQSLTTHDPRMVDTAQTLLQMGTFIPKDKAHYQNMVMSNKNNENNLISKQGAEVKYITTNQQLVASKSSEVIMSDVAKVLIPETVKISPSAVAPVNMTLPTIDKATSSVAIETPVQQKLNELQQSAVHKPLVNKNLVQQPVVNKNVAQQPITHQNFIQKPIADKIEAQQLTSYQSATQQPVVNQSVSQQPIVNQNVIQQPIVNQSAIQQPILHKNVNKQQVGDEIVAQQPIENKNVVQNTPHNLVQVDQPQQSIVQKSSTVISPTQVTLMQEKITDKKISLSKAEVSKPAIKVSKAPEPQKIANITSTNFKPVEVKVATSGEVSKPKTTTVKDADKTVNVPPKKVVDTAKNIVLPAKAAQPDVKTVVKKAEKTVVQEDWPKTKKQMAARTSSIQLNKMKATNIKPASTTVTQTQKLQTETAPGKVQAPTKLSAPKVTEKSLTTSTVANVSTTKISSNPVVKNNSNFKKSIASPLKKRLLPATVVSSQNLTTTKTTASNKQVVTKLHAKEQQPTKPAIAKPTFVKSKPETVTSTAKPQVKPDTSKPTVKPVTPKLLASSTKLQVKSQTQKPAAQKVSVQNVSTKSTSAAKTTVKPVPQKLVAPKPLQAKVPVSKPAAPKNLTKTETSKTVSATTKTPAAKVSGSSKNSEKPTIVSKTHVKPSTVSKTAAKPSSFMKTPVKPTTVPKTFVKHSTMAKTPVKPVAATKPPAKPSTVSKIPTKPTTVLKSFTKSVGATTTTPVQNKPVLAGQQTKATVYTPQHKKFNKVPGKFPTNNFKLPNNQRPSRFPYNPINRSFQGTPDAKRPRFPGNDNFYYPPNSNRFAPPPPLPRGPAPSLGQSSTISQISQSPKSSSSNTTKTLNMSLGQPPKRPQLGPLPPQGLPPKIGQPPPNIPLPNVPPPSIPPPSVGPLNIPPISLPYDPQSLGITQIPPPPPTSQINVPPPQISYLNNFPPPNFTTKTLNPPQISPLQSNLTQPHNFYGTHVYQMNPTPGLEQYGQMWPDMNKISNISTIPTITGNQGNQMQPDLHHHFPTVQPTVNLFPQKKPPTPQEKSPQTPRSNPTTPSNEKRSPPPPPPRPKIRKRSKDQRKNGSKRHK